MQTEFLEKWLRESIRAEGWKKLDHLHIDYLYRSKDKTEWLNDGLRSLEVCNRYVKDTGGIHLEFILCIYISTPCSTAKSLTTLKSAEQLQGSTPPALYLLKNDIPMYAEFFGRLVRLPLSDLQENQEAFLSFSPEENDGCIFIQQKQ